MGRATPGAKVVLRVFQPHLQISDHVAVFRECPTVRRPVNSVYACPRRKSLGPYISPDLDRVVDSFMGDVEAEGA